MFKIHTCDGLTVSVDLKDEAQATEWLQRLKDLSFQRKITGITIMRRCGGRFKCPTCGRATRLYCSTCGEPSRDIVCEKGVQHSLSKPNGYDEVYYQAEYMKPNPNIKLRGGERAVCYAGDNRMILMVHPRQPASRVTLLKTGKRRYNPFTDSE